MRKTKKNTEMRFKAQLSISEVQSNMEEDYVQIEIGDKDSGCLIAKLKLTHHDFTRAVFSHSHTPAEGRLGRNIDLVGMLYEYKNLTVPIKKPLKLYLNKDENESLDIVKKAVRPFEVDGWKAQISNAFNHHHYQYTDHGKLTNTTETVCYSIGFFRWVDPPEETDALL